MALLKVRRDARVTLPADLRRKFNLAAGDYLEARAVKEGILLKPVSTNERQKAGKALLKLLHPHVIQAYSPNSRMQSSICSRSGLAGKRMR